MYTFHETLRNLHNKTLGSPEVCIAVLDTEGDLNEGSLKGARIERLRLGGFKTTEAKSHGTHIAKIIFASGSDAPKGIAPQCKGLFIPVYEDHSSGLNCTQERLANAILLAASHGAHIINISGGMLSPADSSSLRLQAAVDYCHEHRIQVVAAVGNEGCDCLHVPASLQNVLAVGATDEQGEPYTFNNYGWAYQKQGLLVPLSDMDMTGADGSPVKKAASSYAAPVVSGILGVLCSLQLQLGLTPDPVRIKEILLSTSDPCPLDDAQECKRYLAGMVNLDAAIRKLMQEASDKKRSVADEEIIPSDTFKGSLPVNKTEDTSMLTAQAAMMESRPVKIVPSSIPDQSGQLVYALGYIGFQIPSEEVKESLTAEVGSLAPEHFLKVLGGRFTESHQDTEGNTLPDPNLKKNRLYYAEDVLWILYLDDIPAYAIRPEGPFAASVYAVMRDMMIYQIEVKKKYRLHHTDLVRVALAGTIQGTVMLPDGYVIPVVLPDLRGLQVWTVDELLNTLSDRVSGGRSNTNIETDRPAISDFLERIFFALRNTGRTPDERALNFAATNGFLISKIFGKAFRERLTLLSVEVVHSPFCGPEAECRDVLLVFFNPHKQLQEARTVFRFTVNIKGTVPVLAGPVRSWKE